MSVTLQVKYMNVQEAKLAKKSLANFQLEGQGKRQRKS
jgi:hypothetical protein